MIKRGLFTLVLVLPNKSDAAGEFFANNRENFEHDTGVYTWCCFDCDSASHAAELYRHWRGWKQNDGASEEHEEREDR